MDEDEYQTFEPVDALKAGTFGFLLGGGVGLGMAAIQNALAKENLGFFGAFRRGSLFIGGLGATTGSLFLVSTATANVREKQDWKNPTAGGFAAGCIQGLISRSLPKMFGFGTAFAIAMGVTSYTGGLIGTGQAQYPTEYERKEEMRKARRKPIEETLVNIGEGRKIKPPGYEERRIRRLKEKYGIEIQTVPATAADTE